MRRSHLWILIAIVGLCLVVGVRSCGSGPAPRASTAAPPVAGVAPVANTDDAAARAAAEAQARARYALLRDAASTLQAYLEHLARRDRAAADALWINGAPPGVSGEADLRLVETLRGMQITVERPEPLDQTPLPASVEVPVRLRANFSDGPMQVYTGRYRMRLVAPGQWRITSATLQSKPAPV